MRKLLGEQNIKKSFNKRHPSYYMVESEYNKKFLDNWRKERIAYEAK